MSIDLSNADWRTATASNNGGDCVQVAKVPAPGHPKATDGELFAFRDSKNPNDGVQLYSHSEVRAFFDGVKKGEFDDLI